MRLSPGRLARAWPYLLVAAVILFRAAPFVLFPESYFDSDVAVNGLMAKHLAEGKAFPFFMYGQKYLWPVSVYPMAALFAVFGATPLVLKATLLIENLAVGLVLLHAARSEAKLGAWAAVAACAYFVLPSVIGGSRLLENGGGNIEPFAFILAIWLLRRRPWGLPVGAAIGFLNRPFVAYGLLALAVVDRLEGLAKRESYRKWGRVAGAIVVAKLASLAIGPFTANYFGSKGPGPAIKGLGALARDIAWASTETLPRLFGALPTNYAYFNLVSRLDSVAWLSAWPGLLVVFAGSYLAIRRPEARRDRFAIYLLVTGAISFAVFALFSKLVVDKMLVRYVLLCLLAPVGAALIVFGSASLPLRAAAAVGIAIASAGNAYDTWLLLREQSGPDAPVSDQRRLAEYLVSRGIACGRAPYWAAYHVAFLTQEKVRLTSPHETPRISDYDRLLERPECAAVSISDTSCGPEARKAGRWFVCVNDAMSAKNAAK